MPIYKLKQTAFADTALESAQNIIPAANVTHSLGTPEFQWKDLYLSGSTINLGGAQLKTNPTSGAIAFVPAPTEENPNPKATVVSATGTIAAVDTTGGDIDEGDVANAAANTSSTFTDLEATGNITANIFIGDGGLLSNITGVTAETVTGVLTAGNNVDIDSNGLISTSTDITTSNLTASAMTTITLSSNTSTVSIGNVGTTAAYANLDISNFNYFTAVAGDNSIFQFVNTPSNVGTSFVLELEGGGDYTITWPNSVRWPANTAPELSTSGNTDVLVFLTDDSGTIWRAAFQTGYITQ